VWNQMKARQARIDFVHHIFSNVEQERSLPSIAGELILH